MTERSHSTRCTLMVVPEALLDFADGLPRRRVHLQLAPREHRYRERLPFCQRAVAAELTPHAFRFVPRLHAQDELRDLTAKQHDGHQPEQIAHAVRRGDVGLQTRRSYADNPSRPIASDAVPMTPDSVALPASSPAAVPASSFSMLC